MLLPGARHGPWGIAVLEVAVQQEVIRHEAGGILVGAHGGAEGHVVAAPRAQAALGIDGALQEMKAARPVVVVLQVVRAVPCQLDRRPDPLGDRDRLGHRIRVEPTAEAAADARDVHLDLLGIDSEDLGRKLARGVGVLRRGPDLRPVPLDVGEAVLGLEVRRGR